MKIIDDIKDLPAKTSFRGVALGNFDGVHRGHQRLISAMVADAEKVGGDSIVFAFNPHPLQILRGQSPAQLTTQQQKEELVANLGVKYFFRYPFDMEIAKISPNTFIERILYKSLGATHVYVGYNYTFGHKGTGNGEILKQLCPRMGMEVTIIEPVMWKYGAISSSLIRERLMAGDVAAADEMLGYCYYLTGTVVYGRQIGRQLGFATANIEVSPYAQLPAYGVYAAFFQWEGGFWPTVANVGMRPTFGRFANPVVEAHLLGFDGDLYGKPATLHFVERLRGETPFPDKEHLISQIQKDCRHAQKILNATAEKSFFPDIGDGRK